VGNLFDTLAAVYRLEGSTWSVRPELAADWRGTYSASLALAFSRSRYPLLSEAGGILLGNDLFLNTSNDDWKAEAGFTMLSKTIFLTLSLAYEENWVPYSAVYTVGSSKGANLGGNLSWRLHPRLEIDAAAEVTRRLWLAPGYAAGMISGSLALSAGVTSHFP
jgi:hypothetical protein